jgi:predicted RNA polymerase sigma factor
MRYMLLFCGPTMTGARSRRDRGRAARACAELLRALRRNAEARAADERALALAGNVAERALLERRLAEAAHASAADTRPARPR